MTMKRTELKRKTPMKRAAKWGIGAATLRQPAEKAKNEAMRAVVDALPVAPRRAGPEFRYGKVAALLRPPIEKEQALQHEGYMRIVRELPCYKCGVVGFTQFCHADEGKGMGIKTDCRLGWPGCGPHQGLNGCHWFIGTSGTLTKEQRRQFEKRAGDATRRHVIAMSMWPASLPRWIEE